MTARNRGQGMEDNPDAAEEPSTENQIGEGIMQAEQKGYRPEGKGTTSRPIQTQKE